LWKKPSILQTILHLCPKHLRRHYPWKIRSDFDLKELEIFWFQKMCIVLVIFIYLQILFAIKHFGVGQVLTKILQIDQKLTFYVFHVLNQRRNSKIKIYLMRQPSPPPQKKVIFWRVWSFRWKWFWLCLGPCIKGRWNLNLWE